MRELTFCGFLRRYVIALSDCKSASIYALTKEAASTNYRLREPLFLYALCSGTMNTLMSASKRTMLYDEFRQMSCRYSADSMVDMLRSGSVDLPEEYHKVWSSYQSVAHPEMRDNRLKRAIRTRVINAQAETGISTYRVCKDLGFNNSNVNSWIKHDMPEKVSLQTARAIMEYLNA